MENYEIKVGDKVRYVFKDKTGNEQSFEDEVVGIGSGPTNGMYLLKNLGLVPALSVEPVPEEKLSREEDNEEESNEEYNDEGVDFRDIIYEAIFSCNLRPETVEMLQLIVNYEFALGSKERQKHLMILGSWVERAQENIIEEERRAFYEGLEARGYKPDINDLYHFFLGL